MAKTDQWPYDFTSLDKGVTKFAPVQVTIKKLVLRKSDQSVWGWKFEEDETVRPGDFPDVVWSAPQEYDDASGKYQAYKGPRYGPGTRMTVELAMTEKGEEQYFNIRKMTLDDWRDDWRGGISTEAAGTPAAPANEHVVGTARQPGTIAGTDPVPAEWTLPIDYYRERQALERRSIQMQTTFNGLVALLGHDAARWQRLTPPGESSLWTDAEVERMKYQVRTLVLMLVPGLPESEGAQAARGMDAEDLPWGEPPTQPPMDTKKAAH